MKQSQLSPLEKTIAKKIDRTKDKANQPGYLRKLVTKLHLRIEAALARGCEYDDLAKAISETGVKISTATLKQYHTEYRRELEAEAKDISQSVSSVLPPEESPEETQKVDTKSDRKQSAIDKLFTQK
ncbi:hypothetical protein [Myxosarcina sp. GI1]|uniref:hypothetical protein n=1 Tax=Myxosarcina sp. GI1 TaxID=1541065 RepID=UPI00055E2E37|nr:hypothetical protein [Myxosarcina sp. GI1]